MKILLSILILVAGFVAKSQNLKKIIKCDNVEKLEKYITKNDGKLDDQITIELENGTIQNHSAFMFAYAEESSKTIQYLIKHKEIFSNENHIISEVFIYSLSKKEDTISQQLYDLGANPNDSCSVCWNNNALMVAAVYGNEKWFFKLKDSCDYLYINPDGNNLAHMAATSPSSKIARWVFGVKNIDINKKNKEGETPLDFATRNTNNTKVFGYLLKQGAILTEAKNILEYWTINPSEEIYNDNVLFIRRSDVWLRDDDGVIPLIWSLEPDEKGEYKIQQLDLFKQILDMMLHQEQKSNFLKFSNENLYYFNTMDNFLAIAELRGDYEYSFKIYSKFLELCSVSQANSEFAVLTKKNYKRACDLYGAEKVTEVYDDNLLFP